jgi:hypothetical protein
MTNTGESNVREGFSQIFQRVTDQVQIKAEACSIEVNSKHEWPEVRNK